MLRMLDEVAFGGSTQSVSRRILSVFLKKIALIVGSDSLSTMRNVSSST